MAGQWDTDYLRREANRLFPGVHSNLRGMPPKPPFFVRGEAAHIWDSDGKEYIDYMIAVGPGILGYSNKEYIEALKSQLDTLYFSSSASRIPWEIELGQKLIEHIPCAEKVRFCLSGTEAVQLVMRLARAHTGRNVIIRFEGHYHGSLDNVSGGIVNEDPVSNPKPRTGKEDPMFSEGRDPMALENVFRIPWNDAEILSRVLERWGDQVALIMMETHNTAGGALPPRVGYLEKVRELCDQYGVVLCFDEVLTGFRIGLGSGQGEVGVTPDLATYGKAIAGGFPMAVVAGCAEIMDLLLQDRVMGAGTFNGYPMGVVAALSTIRILERDNGVYFKIVDKRQTRLVNGFKEISQRHAVPILITGFRGYFATHFSDRDAAWSVRDLVEVDSQKGEKWRLSLVEQGIWPMWGPKWFVTAALTEQDVDKTLEIADLSIASL